MERAIGDVIISFARRRSSNIVDAAIDADIADGIHEAQAAAVAAVQHDPC